MNYWSKKVIKKLQEKNDEHKNIRALLFELAKDDGYAIKPIRLISIFYDWLKENHKSTMNAQQARNMAEVYCTLSNIYFIAGKKYSVKSAFAVSKKIWDKLKIKQAALENSIRYLKEMGLLNYYNHCYNNNPTRRKRYYKLDRKILEFRINEYNSRQKPSKLDELDELYFDDWQKFKGRKKIIQRTPQVNEIAPMKQSALEPTDYDDINDLFDGGWYFC